MVSPHSLRDGKAGLEAPAKAQGQETWELDQSQSGTWQGYFHCTVPAPGEELGAQQTPHHQALMC